MSQLVEEKNTPCFRDGCGKSPLSVIPKGTSHLHDTSTTFRGIPLAKKKWKPLLPRLPATVTLAEAHNGPLPRARRGPSLLTQGNPSCLGPSHKDTGKAVKKGTKIIMIFRLLMASMFLYLQSTRPGSSAATRLSAPKVYASPAAQGVCSRFNASNALS